MQPCLPEVKHKTCEFEVIDTGPLQPATTEVRLQGASLHLLSFLFPSGTTWLQSLPEPPPAHQQPPCKTSGCTLTQRTCWTLQLVNKFNSAGSGEKTWQICASEVWGLETTWRQVRQGLLLPSVTKPNQLQNETEKKITSSSSNHSEFLGKFHSTDIQSFLTSWFLWMTEKDGWTTKA